MMENMQIGFIGTGTIGKPIAQCLLSAHPSLLVFDVDTSATESLVADGARRAQNVAEIANECELVFASLPGPPQIEAVMLGADGLLAHAERLTTIVDLSTNALKLNRNIASRAAEKAVSYLDAPVSGGARAALKGALSVMVGGDEAVFRTVRPVIECFAEHINYMGESGAGTLTKLVNNQIFLCASVLVQEGFLMGAKAGMDTTALLEVLNASSAAPIVKRAPLVLSRDFDMGVFALGIAAKDVAVALDSARDMGVAMPMTEAANDVYQQAMEAGLAQKDFFATIKILEQMAEVELAPLKTD